MENSQPKKKPTLNLSIFTTLSESFSLPSPSNKSPRNFVQGGVVGLGIVAAMTDLTHQTKPDVTPAPPIPIPIVSSAKAATANFKGRLSDLAFEDEVDELSESYTCVISHLGTKLEKRVYFDDKLDGVVGCGGGGGDCCVVSDGRVGVFSASPVNFGDAYMGIWTADFLSSCYLCKKQLHGLDIFMFFIKTLSTNMLALPPPPATLAPPPPQKQTIPVSLDQIVISKQNENQPNQSKQAENKQIQSKQAEYQQKRAPNTPKSVIRKSRNPSTLLEPRPRRTNPIIWCSAILCLIFCLILIFFGVATLITFLVIKPRYPLFDIPNANLNAIYFDSPEYFNGDFTFLANFSNPNRKINVRFEYLSVELFFSDRLIATQAIEPFTQRRGEKRLEAVHFISSLVFLPQNLAVELQKQVQSNKVSYNVRGTYKVKATLGLIRISYWLHSRCQLQMTGPPTGVLVARSCRTTR